MTLSRSSLLMHDLCHWVGNDIKQLVRYIFLALPETADASEESVFRNTCIIFVHQKCFMHPDSILRSIGFFIPPCLSK